MSYPNPANPREVRSYMHGIYERYAKGVDAFPKARLAVEPESLPLKTRQIAGSLVEAWRIIDLDREYFRDSTRNMMDTLRRSDQEEARGLVLSKVGRNAVNFSSVTLEAGEFSIVHGTFSGNEKEELVRNLGIQLNDGRQISVVEGSLDPAPQPDALVLRQRPDGVASYFESQRLGGTVLAELAA